MKHTRTTDDGGREMIKSGYVTSEFWLYMAAAGFAMWAGWYALVHPEVEMERFLAIIGAVTAAAWAYGNQRTSLKRDVVAKSDGVEMGGSRTTIVAPTETTVTTKTESEVTP